MKWLISFLFYFLEMEIQKSEHWVLKSYSEHPFFKSMINAKYCWACITLSTDITKLSHLHLLQSLHVFLAEVPTAVPRTSFPQCLSIHFKTMQLVRGPHHLITHLLARYMYGFNHSPGISPTSETVSLTSCTPDWFPLIDYRCAVSHVPAAFIAI